MLIGSYCACKLELCHYDGKEFLITMINKSHEYPTDTSNYSILSIIDVLINSAIAFQVVVIIII